MRGEGSKSWAAAVSAWATFPRVAVISISASEFYFARYIGAIGEQPIYAPIGEPFLTALAVQNALPKFFREEAERS